MKKTTEWINETKIWFLKKINKIDKTNQTPQEKKRERGLKSRKLETKKVQGKHRNTKDHEREITTSNYRPIKRKTSKKCTNS